MDRLNRGSRRQGGFTLIELAVVVLVVTLLLGSLLIPLATQVEQRNVSETQKRLQEVKEALMGYAIANGRFPCPAESTGATSDEGKESWAVGGTTANGNCKHFFDGFVPGKTLGVANLDSQGFVVDAWGLQQNRIRYAISNATFNLKPNTFTRQAGMQDIGIHDVGTPTTTLTPANQRLLYVCASSLGATAADCGSGGPPSNALSEGDTVFVVYSLGKNAATTGVSGTASPDEQVNLNGNPVFVSKVVSNQSGGGGEFDDVLVYASRFSIVSQLVAAGQLP